MRNILVLIPLISVFFAASGQADLITSMIIDGEENIYLGSSTGLSRMATDGRQVTRILDHVDVHALAWSKRHGVIVGCNGDQIWNAEGRHLLSLGDPDVRIRCMMISGSLLWIGTNNGVYVVSLAREEVTDHYTPQNSALTHLQINTMYVDGSGIKWIGTESGVVRIEGEKKWKTYEENTRFLAIAGNVEGVWLAADKEMWLVDPYNRWTPTNVTAGLSQGEIRSVATDKQGRIYLLSDIFVQFNPYTDEIVPIDDQTPANVAQNVALAVDHDDQLWVATRQDGLRMIDPEVELIEKPLIATVLVNHPTCAGMSDGSIELVAEGGRGPYQYVWSDSRFTSAKAAGLPAGEYTFLIVDANGREYEDVVVLHQADPLSARIGEDASAEGQTLVVSGTGGRGDYTYLWNTGAKTRRLPVEDPGTFAATITDANGCTATATYTIEPAVVAVEEPDPDLVLQEDTTTSVTIENLKVLDVTKLNVGQVLRIEQLQFKADSSTIEPESYEILDGITAFLQQNENIIIEIGGHTNGLPDHEYCDRLSTARAKSVADYIYSKGVPAGRITYKGYGKRDPIATNATVEGRRKNQRVEVKILEL